MPVNSSFVFFFFFNDTATTEIYTLSLHDALPIWSWIAWRQTRCRRFAWTASCARRSEEHTSELRSRENLVCRLLLETKKKKLSSSTILLSKKSSKSTHNCTIKT